ncbi:hypothetical protein [Actinomadura sp. 9N215]|uniref:hypothetical protein n=1 Tax=Actinomadura sp. 9N215 TaxID=3375150 RepID=UPI0037BBF81E
MKWIFAHRLAGHSMARITRALNDMHIPCPSVADPRRNAHRTNQGVDVDYGADDSGQPALHRPVGVEPSAFRA